MLHEGLAAEVGLVVAAADTALALGSGDVEVLGTPRLVALCEAATVAAIADALADGQTSVGTRVELDHLRASRVGATVRATATLTRVDGSRLTFAVEAVDGDDVVARGVVRRAVVDRSRFGS